MNSTINQRLPRLVFLLTLIITPFYVLSLRGIINFPASINLGFAEVQFYSIFILTGVLVSAYLFDRQKQTYPAIKSLDTIEALLWIFVPAVLGARIWHVITDFDLYQDNLIESLYVWNGGLGIFGAILGGVMGAYLFSMKDKTDLQKGLALLAVFLPLGQVIGRFGNFANRELYGSVTNLPWGLYLGESGSYVHPTFAYEQVGNLLLFYILYFYYRKCGLKAQLIPLYLIGYSIVRFITDFYRTEQKVFLNLTVAQITSILLVLLASLYFVKLRSIETKKNGNV